MPQHIIEFWFSENVRKQWFRSTSELDDEIRNRFESVWIKASKGELDAWMSSGEGCLALTITLDQFPLNMFRGDAKSFSTEEQAIRIAKHALKQKFDSQLTKEHRVFIYMPLMHSENLIDQELSVTCFEMNDFEANTKFARHHLGIIKKYGRFPHRNAILGRESTLNEIAYLNSKEAFTG